jgi:5'-nucleotidase / UDP-sugar diphosphatase
MIARRTAAHKDQGPVLTLDSGDYSMGTAFSAATREVGGELQLMSRMGYDATAFGSHEFDLGPDGLGKTITVASKAGPIPAVLAANTNVTKDGASLAELQRLFKEGTVRRYRNRAWRNLLWHLRRARQRSPVLTTGCKG